ncbi:uncharacterized protein LOC115630200 [Scaptodrosophila lebanonensis]|uniref:Uncharacterized protein LOC115630200 n=1 Tax=Drosophila lebanonensis TaxID=7225 RepID=A0A6J2U545_DROLE|nr:uncharacterized protein LOC115630200 [Scaptodrosophila lebanonensis]
MKLIIAAIVLAVSCLAGINAGPAPAHGFASLPAPFQAQVFTVVEDMIHLGEETAKALVHQYEEIVVEPHQQLEEAIDNIEARRAESPQCVASQDDEINAILDTVHEEMHDCTVVAAHTSAEIATDVNQATQQLVFGGLSLGRTYNKCQNYKNSVLKQSCMAKFYIQATVYLVQARSSIKTIKQSTNERIPAVFVEGNVCTHNAADEAVNGLNEVNRSIDVCVAKKLRH